MLDLFFKKYVWLANAALLLAAAWIGAKTVNTVAGALIRPRPALDLATAPAAAPPPAARPTLAPDKLYALLGQSPPAPEPVADAAAAPAAPARPQNCADPRAAPVRSSLRGQLVGSALSDRPEWSIASITDLGTRETRVYGFGDLFQGARLIGVERIADERDATGSGFRVAAVLCNDGQKEFIDYEGVDGAATATPYPAVPPIARAPVPPSGGGAPAAPSTEGIRKVSDTQYEIERSVIDSTLSNLNAVATQARIVPSFKNGVANGFKLFSIQPGSLYSSIGIENGDVIQRINGYEINSPDKALEVYQKLRSSSHITIELERNGRSLRKEYNVSGP
jgi:general secretion pathway protein C